MITHWICDTCDRQFITSLSRDYEPCMFCKGGVLMPDVAFMSAEDVQAELDRRGIDTTSAEAKVIEAARKARERQ